MEIEENSEKPAMLLPGLGTRGGKECGWFHPSESHCAHQFFTEEEIARNLLRALLPYGVLGSVELCKICGFVHIFWRPVVYTRPLTAVRQQYKPERRTMAKKDKPNREKKKPKKKKPALAPAPAPAPAKQLQSEGDF